MEEEWAGTPCTGRPIQLPPDALEYALEGLEPGMCVYLEVRPGVGRRDWGRAEEGMRRLDRQRDVFTHFWTLKGVF